MEREWRPGECDGAPKKQVIANRSSQGSLKMRPPLLGPPQKAAVPHAALALGGDHSRSGSNLTFCIPGCPTFRSTYQQYRGTPLGGMGEEGLYPHPVLELTKKWLIFLRSSR